MGWSFIQNATRDSILVRLKQPDQLSPGYTMLEHRVVGNNHWFLYRRPDGTRSIGLNLLKAERNYGYGYKGLTEDMGTCELNCPLSLLSQADAATGHAAAWREKVRAYHAAKTQCPTYAAGTVVRYCSHEYRLDRPASTGRGWIATRIGDGNVYRFGPTHLRGATVVAA